MNSAAPPLPPLPGDLAHHLPPLAPPAQPGLDAPTGSGRVRTRGARRESTLAASLVLAAHAAGLVLLATQTTAAVRPPELSAIEVALKAQDGRTRVITLYALVREGRPPTPRSSPGGPP